MAPKTVLTVAIHSVVHFKDSCNNVRLYASKTKHVGAHLQQSLQHVKKEHRQGTSQTEVTAPLMLLVRLLVPCAVSRAVPFSSLASLSAILCGREYAVETAIKCKSQHANTACFDKGAGKAAAQCLQQHVGQEHVRQQSVHIHHELLHTTAEALSTAKRSECAASLYSQHHDDMLLSTLPSQKGVGAAVQV